MSLVAQGPVLMRLSELKRDGYITSCNGHFILTEKGWRCLLASADPLLKEPPSKSS